MIGSARNVGTTTDGDCARRARSRARPAWCWSIWRSSSPNVDVISDEPNAPGIADLVRGTASFGDIITRDRFSRLHLVAAGQVGR